MTAMPTLHSKELVQQITYENRVLAIIIFADFHKPGIHFFTPNNYSQQLAYMNHHTGKVIPPHVHNPVRREVFYTQEVLLIKKGKLRVDFYNPKQQYIESRVLEAGDIILLIEGGHGFEVLEEIEMIEIKQGPFVGETDKTRFTGVSSEQINLVK